MSGRGELPCPTPEGIPDCPYFKTKQSCHSDVHHQYWPSSDYNTTLEHVFRNLEENKIEVCRRIHEHIHRTERPPAKPSREEMFAVVDAAVTEERVVLSVGKYRRIYGTL